MTTSQFAFRITPDFEDAVQVELVSEGRVVSRPRVAAMSTARLVLGLGPKEGKAVRGGDTVTIRLRSERLAGVLELPGRVSSVHGEAHAPMASVVLDTPIHEDGATARKVGSLFNQRRAYRVRPSDNTAIVVWVKPKRGGEYSQGRLVDLSVLGMGLWVQGEEADQFRLGRKVLLTFTLPGEKHRITASGTIRSVHQGRANNIRRLGLELAMDRIDAAGRRAITRYVMGRQLEERRTTQSS